jgi:hypothetical protein
MFVIDLPKAYSIIQFDEVRNIVCKTLQQWPDETIQPYLDYKFRLQRCDWFRIYDVVERVYAFVWEKTWHSNPGAASLLAKDINSALMEQNIGWQLVDGRIVTRGDEAFEGTIEAATDVLKERSMPTAVEHLHNAIIALSKRPKADTSGAVAHATNAVECVLGEITGEATTLGKYLDKYPSLFHPALKKGLNGVYGYASDEGARHGKEGTEPSPEDAEFVVATCAAVCTLLSRKRPR